MAALYHQGHAPQGATCPRLAPWRALIRVPAGGPCKAFGHSEDGVSLRAAVSSVARGFRRRTCAGVAT
eukprot:11235048-Alexandrium_andersonii.AAC.1